MGMHRIEGPTFLLPWPADIPRGEPVKPGHQRDATPSEIEAAEQIIRDECERRGLVPVQVRVANVRPSYEREYDQRLVVLFTLKASSAQ